MHEAMHLRWIRWLKLTTTIVGLAAITSFGLVLKILLSVPVCTCAFHHLRRIKCREHWRWVPLEGFQWKVRPYSFPYNPNPFFHSRDVRRQIHRPNHYCIQPIPPQLGGDTTHLRWYTCSRLEPLFMEISHPRLTFAFPTHGFASRVGSGWYITSNIYVERGDGTWTPERGEALMLIWHSLMEVVGWQRCHCQWFDVVIFRKFRAVLVCGRMGRVWAFFVLFT